MAAHHVIRRDPHPGFVWATAHPMNEAVADCFAKVMTL